MSNELEAIELLREWRFKWVGEFMQRKRSLYDRTDDFLAKHDIMKCHCGGLAEMSDMGYESPSTRSVRQFNIWCPECGHAGKSAHSKGCAKRNWEFAQEAIREKRFNDRVNDAIERRINDVTKHLKKCPECGK